MELSSSWEDASRSNSEQFSNILWNPKVHYSIHQSPCIAPYLEPDESSPYHPILFL
jgi:hypothetical protein